jgi:hypothetical protein
MQYSAQDILDGFTAVDPHVRFALKNSRGLGYYCVLGPSHGGGTDCWVKVERYNGTVAFASPIAQYMGALERPRLGIRQHPLGHSSGPNFRRFDRALASSDIRQRFPRSAADFAKLVLQGFRATGTHW